MWGMMDVHAVCVGGCAMDMCHVGRCSVLVSEVLVCVVCVWCGCACAVCVFVVRVVYSVRG